MKGEIFHFLAAVDAVDAAEERLLGSRDSLAEMQGRRYLSLVQPK